MKGEFIMFNKIVSIKHNYTMPNISNDMSITTFGDLHYCSSFDDKRLNLLTEYLFNNDSKYLFIAGDLIDSTNFLHDDKRKKERLVSWLKLLSDKYKLFITLGSHDFTTKSFKNGNEDWNTDLWKNLNDSNNIHVSHYTPYYEDDNLIAYQLELGYDYYFSGDKENKDYLLNFLDENLNYLDNLDNSKVKVLVCHSPIYMSDKDVIDRVKEYDFIFSGHMHNGMIPYPFDKIKGNTGIIAPDKSLFPDNARGTKDINVGDKDIHLIINGGITKLSECTNVLSKFNNIYKMNIDEIEINSKIKKLVK